jgi:predicted nucleic acid-binding protein
MRILYADTSALARLYLQDEPDSDQLIDLLLASPESVVTSELARLELARAVKSAERAGRLLDAAPALERIDAHLGTRIALIELRAETILPRARDFVLQHRLNTLDAIHLAVAIEESESLGEPIVFVTRDSEQAIAARELGLEVG